MRIIFEQALRCPEKEQNNIALGASPLGSTRIRLGLVHQCIPIVPRELDHAWRRSQQIRSQTCHEVSLSGIVEATLGKDTSKCEQNQLPWSNNQTDLRECKSLDPSGPCVVDA